MDKMKYIAFFFAFAIMTDVHAQSFVLPLWGSDMPNYRKTDEKEASVETDIVRISKVQNPTIEVYLPAKKAATGQAVVICPGGGYRILAYDWEGTDIAKWLNAKGIAGIVLKYRLPDSKSNVVTYKSPLIDAQRAIRVVRYNSEKWNIDKEKVGVMGFSAGGHLASTLGTHFDDKLFESSDLINMISARPNFMALIYPVISMNFPHVHEGSRNSLLGLDPSAELINEFSNELQVKENTPPTFLVHSQDDNGVPVENSLMFYQALREKGVEAEMHLFPKGGHGYSMALNNKSLNAWTDMFANWLERENERTEKATK